MGTTEQDREHIGVRVDPEMKQQIRVAAAEQGVSISEFLRQAAEQQIGER